MQALTNSDRLAARIKALPKGRLITLQVVIGEDGEPIAWVIVGQAKLEGLTSAQSVIQSRQQNHG